MSGNGNKRPSASRKDGRKGQRRAGKAPSKGDYDLVPYVDKPLTDALRLPTVPEHVYSCIKTYQSDGFLVQSSTVPVTGVFAVNASVCTDFSSLAAVFDQYRVTMVEVLLRPQATESIISGTQPTGQLAVVIDYDDQTPLANMAAAAAYSNAIIQPVTQNLRRCFKPKIAVAGYGSSVFNQFTNVPWPWTDTTSTSLVGYGTKYFLETGAAGALASYNLTVRTHFEFKSSR